MTETSLGHDLNPADEREHDYECPWYDDRCILCGKLWADDCGCDTFPDPLDCRCDEIARDRYDDEQERRADVANERYGRM